MKKIKLFGNCSQNRNTGACELYKAMVAYIKKWWSVNGC